MTSVKDFRVETPPTADTLGAGAFLFTDAYSVFDWGQMPDPIPDKGASLCTMGAYNFELLEANGIPTHYRGVLTAESDQPQPLTAVSEPPTEMAIDLTQVPELPYTDGSYEYDAYHAAAGDNYLVPLEIVFRNYVPVGSSLRRRTTPTDHGLEYETWPDHGVELDEPIIEFSTKYEESDRYLDQAEADRIAGTAAIDALASLARSVNSVVTEYASQQGFRHEDGKIEVLYFDGELRVADVVGTFDENRFAYDGQQLSKEVIRQYHRREQSDWVDAVSQAKQAAKAQGIADWRDICSLSPDPLPSDVLSTVRDMYASGANAYIGRELFDAPPITATVDAVQALLETDT